MTKDILTRLKARVSRKLTAETALRPIDQFDFPLAFNQSMPDDFETTNGHIGIRFSDFVLTGAGPVRLDEVQNDKRQIKVAWDRLRLDGRCALTGKPAPVITLDTGGTLMDLEDPQPAGSDPMAPMDPAEKDAMLEQARLEREKLRDTPNGQALLAKYNEHNETYNTVFATSTTCRNTWTQHGATREMSQHTHIALKEDDSSIKDINPVPDEKTFGTKKISYNANAFVQQWQIVINTISKDPSMNIWKNPEAKLDPNSKYVKAALAAMDFGKASAETGNTKSDIKTLDAQGVHASVDKGTPPPPTSVAELDNAMKQGVQDGGAPAAEAAARNWRVLDEEDRRMVRQSFYLNAVEEVENEKLQYDPIWEGACFAELSGAEARVTLHEDGTVDEITIHLPAFEFDIDDSAWAGGIADVSRNRLAEVGFARSFILERVQSSLKEALLDAMTA